MKYLNLGCGNRFFGDWVNVDFVSTGPCVQSHNLLEGIPFPNESFDIIYHSHVLEHFKKADAIGFVKECFRVLKPKGVLRVVVPDLEQIVKEYLMNLEGAKRGEKIAKENYDWIMLEIYDQVVRNVSGGEMAKYWRRGRINNEEYIKKRMGSEFEAFRDNLLKVDNSLNSSGSLRWRKYIQQKTYRNKLGELLSKAFGVQNHIAVGKFRASGEIHQWMYDEYSLGELLKNQGFVNIERKSAFESNIPGWKNYAILDVENGRIRKPDSLFMEASK
jgi:predicted SAM-dependent methyltransferase